MGRVSISLGRLIFWTFTASVLATAIEARPRRNSIQIPYSSDLLTDIALGLLVPLVIFTIIYAWRWRKKVQEEKEKADGELNRKSRKSSKKINQTPIESAEFESLPTSVTSGDKIQDRPTNVVVTEKTRVQINNMITNIKTLQPAEVPPEAPAAKAEIEAIETSGVFHALAETMVSEPQIEQSQVGKFSKMSLDAGLIFDAEDLAETPKSEVTEAADEPKSKNGTKA